MSQTERFVANAKTNPDRYRVHVGQTARPTAGVAIVACMDSRLDLFSLFGLELGEAHIIRNAGGLVTDDVLRSLAISQRFLGTEEIILVHHTGCGAHGLDDAAFVETLFAETGQRPGWKPGGFADPAEDVRESMARIEADPFLVSKKVRGFVFDVADGRLEEVSP